MILITQPRAGTSHNEILALQAAAHEVGWDVLGAPPGWRLGDELIKSAPAGVPYGSQTFCEVIAMQMNWRLKQNSFDWLAKLPERFLKRNVQFMTLGEAKRIQEKKFIKPADDKVFAARVYEPGTLIVPEMLSDDTPTLVSDVVEWDLEYRCFTNGYSVKAWSNYLFYGEINDPRYHHMINQDYESPQNFVDHLLRDYKFETAPSVIDVGVIRGKGMAVIETNQAWASGIYGCDPAGVLNVLEASCSL